MFKPLQGTPDMYRALPEQFWSRGITLPNTPLVDPMLLDMNKVRNPLRINRIDLCISDNGTRHHTDKFNAMKSKDNPHLIVRRGQVFYLKLLLDRDYEPQVDGVSFVFIPAGSENDKFNVTKKNDVVVLVLESVPSDEKHFKWYACVVDSEEKEMLIKVHPAPSCLVGEWKMQVDTKLQIELDGETYPVETPIIILFNPWCANDQVYMKDGDKRQEYVLNETGLVFRGSYNNVQSTPWFFGQFEKDILQCAIMLYTEVREVATPNRNNPIDICRSLSASMNSVDGKGVLVGKWDGKYELKHTRPEAWAGSVKILTKYYKTRQPVKYGQCWVFAGVCTTVCRALGIPCRPVTVYNCAYDADCNMLVDQYLEESSKWMPTANCIWHHRVWNEVWITRWDLQKSNHPLQKLVTYDGWNVIDDCTHKTWSISYCEGPVSVKAIRDGNFELAYNTWNAYAKVNANILYWKNIEDKKQLKMVGKDINWVGCKIVTKAIGSYKCRDITQNYKYPEGWAEKREMKMVLRYIENHINRLYLNTNFKKIKYEIKLPEEPPMVGSPIELCMIIHNYNVEMYEVEVNIVLCLENYAGTDKIPIMEEQLKVQIQPKEDKQHTLRVTYDDYKDCNLKEEDNFRIGCHAFIKQKDYDYFIQDVLKMRKPKLSFMVNTSHHPTSSTQQVSLYEDDSYKQYINQEEHFEVEQEQSSKHIKELLRTSKQDVGFLRQCMGPFNVNVDQEFQIQASFTNPLPVSLTNGYFQFEGPDKVQKLPLDRDILPGSLAVGKCQWRVMTPGKYEICGTYVSNELKEPGMKPLKVDTIDACISENVRQHHTDAYDLMESNNDQLIVRRGQAFYLRLALDRNYLPQEDRLSLVFHLTGHLPGMEMVVPLMERVEDEHDDNHSWYASVVSQEDSSVYIKVHASPSCIVGEWKLRVDTRLQHDTISYTYHYPGSVIILINPWCPHDRVYIEDDCHKQEYVLSESDIMFCGSEDSTPWFFGQFKQDDLQCGMMQFTDPHPLVQTGSHDAIYMIRRPSTAEEEQLLCQYIRDRFKGDVDAVPITFDEFKNYVLQCEEDSSLSSKVIICETDALEDCNDFKFSDFMDVSTVFIPEECTLLNEDNLKLSALQEGESSKRTSTMIIPERDLEQCAPQNENCSNIITPQDRDNMKVSALWKDDLDVTTVEDKDDFNINAQKDEDDMKVTDLQDGNELTVSSPRDESDMEFGSVALTSADWTYFVKEDVTELSEAEPNIEEQTMIKDLVATSSIDSFRIEPLRDLKQTPMIAPRMGVKGPLTIQTIDLCISENGAKHRTDRYKQMRAKDNAALIVRRGQPFYLHVTLDRGYSPRDDGLSLMFLLAGNKNSFTSSTNIIVPVTQHQKDEHHINGWYASVVRSKGKCVYMKIQASTGCVIGEYTIQLDAKLDGEITGSSYTLPHSVFILFNPWCQYDEVYMEDKNYINEYVLNDYGVMFSGSYNNVQSMPWFYGQFDQDVLQSALLLLPNFQCNASSIVRSIITTLSADNGLQEAGGSDDSERGQHGAWTGSVDILAEYSRRKRHCLAMAGTCTTVCRALGIPCRPVTVYNAARGDGLLVDRYFHNEPFAHDTIRAYHVWNEVWIERADLVPGDNASWNVIDAMPGNRCGPASVKAVKRGEMLKVYDTKFVHATVNASVVVWKHLAENKPRKLMNVNTNGVGSLIVTKSLGNNRYMDITDNYKFTERCQEESRLVKKCLQSLTYCTSRYYVNADFRWVNCELILPDSTMIGSPIKVKLVVRNFHATDAYNVDVKMTVGIQSNDSDKWCPVKLEEFNLQILPNRTGETLALTATYEDYKQFTSQHDDYFKVTCTTFIPEVDYDYFKEDIVSLSKPKLKIKLQSLNGQEETVSNKFHMVATFTNPLPVQLTNGVFQFEGHDNKETIQLDREVPPYEAASATCQWDVLFPRMCTIVGTFTSNELKDVRGIFQFTNINDYICNT